MSLDRRLVSPWLALSLLLAACGKDPAPLPASSAGVPAPTRGTNAAKAADAAEQSEAADAPSHIAMLIPPETAIYIQVQSLPRFDVLISRLAEANASLGTSIDELGRALHRQIPGDDRYLQKDRPIGIAVSLPKDREPEFTFVMPVKDMVAYKRSIVVTPHMPQPVFDGSYLAVTNAALYERPREPVALALGTADQSIVVRMDLPRIDHRYGSNLRLALAAMASGVQADQQASLPAEPNLRALIQGLADPVLYALAVGQQLEAAFEVEGDRIQVNCAMQTRDAGVLAAWTSTAPVDLAPFARSLVASDSISFVGGCDPSVFAERVAALVTDGKAQRERISGLLESFSDLFSSLGAVSGSLSAGASHFALHVRASDDPAFSRNLASTFELFSRSGLGVVVQSKRECQIEGVEVEELLVHFDAASMCMLTGERAENLPAVQTRLNALLTSMFGSDTVRVRITNFGNRGLIAIGNDEAWVRRTLLWAKDDRDLTPPDMRAALEHLGSARAAAIVRLELARWTQDHGDWARQWRAISEPMSVLGAPGEASLLALDPQPLTVHVGAEGRTLRMGLSIGLSIDRAAKMARR